MNLPPMIMRVKVGRKYHGVNLWLPLFIIVPIVMIIMLALLIVILPFLLLATLLFWRLDWWRLLLSIPVILECLSAARGLEVDVSRGSEKVFISIE